MSYDNEQFQSRLNRIQRSRRGRRKGMGFVVHPDGVVTAIGRPSSRLRFAFPLKGIIAGLFVAVAVKAYLIWFLGVDVYTLEVQSLLTGSSFERIAGLILLPDALTNWMVDRYEDFNVFVRGGLAAQGL
ncbi:hypothetical protein HKCCE4037_08150 [Rhodobacterales bacterium HKCCE4037]|nr:hypothetical protein [Rhodobacterales bacterium HKCCE4037]